MKRVIFCLLFLCAFARLNAQTVPSLVNYQGRLLDPSGNPRSGNVSIEIGVYTNATLGVASYNETLNPVAVNNGLFSFQFGGQPGFATSLANPEAWLEVRVNGTLVGPRSRLVAVPYAAAAGAVRGANLFENPTSGNLALGTYANGDRFLSLRSAGGTQYRNGLQLRVFSDTVGFDITHDDRSGQTGLHFNRVNQFETIPQQTVLYLQRDGDNPRVGIGTTAPAEKLEVNGALKLGTTSNPTPAAGTIRWTGTAFEGFNGTAWIPLGQYPPLVNIEMVTVGNPGNADDPGSNGLGGNSGAVAYEYKIGKYEVTNGEYATFLNVVDSNGLNALALYNASMGSNTNNGGISFTAGNPDGAKYTVKAGYASKPVVYVSFYDAMRFCNWLHNGAQAGGDTENGAYTLLGNSAAPSNGTTVTRNAGAKFAVPSEDEWYKAAYYQPEAQGGDTDSYWFYPTKSNSMPSNSAPPGTAPAANFDFAVGSVIPVGSYTTTAGFYGTFDMAGNVSEWEDTIQGGSSRVLRGGSWILSEGNLPSIDPDWVTPDFEFDIMGFRVSSP